MASCSLNQRALPRNADGHGPVAMDTDNSAALTDQRSTFASLSQKRSTCSSASEDTELYSASGDDSSDDSFENVRSRRAKRRNVKPSSPAGTSTGKSKEQRWPHTILFVPEDPSVSLRTVNRNGSVMAPLLRGRIPVAIGAATCATIFFLCGVQIRHFGGGRRRTSFDGSAGCPQWMPTASHETFTENEVPAVPTVYVVTPTYRRPTQIPDLVRVAQALMLATGVFWVLVEDSTRPTEAVSRLLRDCGIPHVHLLGPCPPELRTRVKGRGVSARRTALAWVQANATLPGVLYFADDDNSYDYRLFNEIRWTQVVSVFPVGSMRITGFSSPVVVDGSVVGFHDPYLSKRRFAVDMAGFAVNLRLLINNTQIYMPHKEGRQETEFLESLNVSISDLEPLCENATKVLVWHTQTKPSTFPSTAKISRKYRSQKTNLNALIRYINY